MFLRGVVRHPKFDESVAALPGSVPRLEEAISGALWAIARQPDKDGVYIQKYGVWQARFRLTRSSPSILLYYSFNDRYLYALCARMAEDEVG